MPIPDQEDQLHLWADLRPTDLETDVGEQVRLIAERNGYSELRLIFGNQVLLLAKPQWKLLRSFLKHGMV